MSSRNDTKTFVESKGLGNLRTKSDIELKELLDRQEHLLSNRFLVNKLKDKGEKIKKVKCIIIEELESRKTKQSSNLKKTIENSTEVEWKDSGGKSNEDHEESTENETDALKILSENGQIPLHETHITRLIGKEKDAELSFMPYNPAVDERIKKVVPDAHTTRACPSLIKTIHLNESLNLLSHQMSALKILGRRSKRVDECIEDRIKENAPDEDDSDDTDDHETKAGLGVSVNLSI